MSRENSSILFEGRDTHNRQILVLGIWLFVIMGITALLMIPLTHYLWDAVKDSSSAPAEARPKVKSPDVILEVLPGQEYKQMYDQNELAKADSKIDHAMKEMLEKGFPVKS